MHNPIQISPEAAQHLQKSLAEHDGCSTYILSLKPDGCSGYQFHLQPVQHAGDDDVVVTEYLAVQRAYYAAVAGLQIELERQGMWGFTLQYNLPQASNYCGCGKSFQLDNTEGA